MSMTLAATEQVDSCTAVKQHFTVKNGSGGLEIFWQGTAMISSISKTSQQQLCVCTSGVFGLMQP